MNLAPHLEKEIHGVYVRKYHLVLTSRFIADRFDGPEFERFRKVRVLELDDDQQDRIVRLRVRNDEDFVGRFSDQLRSNASLREMAKNPLLLNLCISVFIEVRAGLRVTFE